MSISATLKKTAKDFNSKDFKEYIQQCITINLYIDKLQNHIERYEAKKSFNYEELGKAFIGLMFYQQSPDTYQADIKKAIKGLKSETQENIKDLITIYNQTMSTNYKNYKNGLKGGAPKGNKNASKE